MVLQRSLLVDLLRAIGPVALLMVVLFGSAGRWNLPFFWAYIGVTAILALAGMLTVDPDLQQERWHPAARDTEFWVMLLIGLPCVLGHWVVAGLDVGRFHWSDRVSLAAQIAGLIVSGASWRVTIAAMGVNRFFSPVVRIQTERGHHLVTAGPYHYVRHPGYAGAIIGLMSSSLALGSWWAVVPVGPLIGLITARTVSEDRFLQKELPGYVEYANRVRYRLLPGLW